MIYVSIRTLLHAVFRLLFTLEYYGVDHIPPTGPVILAGNHPSYLDPVLVILPVERRVYFMAWDQLFKIPVLGLLLRQFGAFPVRLESRDPNAYAAALEVLVEGRALGIFPEAGRSKEGPMNPLKTGTARLAIEASAPIVPVTITGAFDAWPSSRRLPFPRKITVKYHEPIILGPADVADRGADRGFHEEIMTEVRERIERRLIPSLAADARKRRVFEGPASPIRIFELYPLAAAFVGSTLGGSRLSLYGLAVVHAAYVIADIWWIPQGRFAKAVRELVTPVVSLLMGPLLAPVFHVTIPEWISLVVFGAGASLCFNWANRYSAERYTRGALMAFFLAFLIALRVPQPFAPHIAVSSFTLLYALAWRPLYWYVLAPVSLVYCGGLIWIVGRGGVPGAAACALLALATAFYVRFVKFSAHDGRMI